MPSFSAMGAFLCKVWRGCVCAWVWYCLCCLNEWIVLSNDIAFESVHDCVEDDFSPGKISCSLLCFDNSSQAPQALLSHFKESFIQLPSRCVCDNVDPF